MPPDASPDPAVRLLAQRRDSLLAEMDRLRRSLIGYASGVRAPESRAAMSPLDHYAMLDSPDCGCATCVEWEQRRAEFIAATRIVPKGHKWTVCGCPECRFVGRIQMNYLAATNRRDLLIEVAYHARHHSAHPELVMRWLEKEMNRSEYTINWCAQEMGRYPMEWWLRRCETVCSGAVSGAIWRNSTMVTDLEVHIPSTLGAMAEAPSWIG